MKRIAYSLAVLCLVFEAPALAQQEAQDGSTLGLAERRIVKFFQENSFPELTQDANEAAGKALEYEVNWNQLAEKGSSHLYQDSWPQIYFEPLVQALEAITVDDLGQQAIEQGLEKIVIRNQEGCYSPDCWASFTGKTLTLDHKLANVGDTDARAKALQTVLENGL